MIKLSIIMPVYNSGIYLYKAVDSILSQSLKDFELILVDDGSFDGSGQVCDKYAIQDDRVKVIHQKNGGICNARNAALKIAIGEYIGWADHDDEYLPEAFEKAYLEAKRTNADLLKYSKKYICVNGQMIVRNVSFSLPYHTYQGTETKNAYLDLYDASPFSCIWDGLYKHEIISKHDLKLDESFKHGGEDVDFNLNFLKFVNILTTIPDVLYLHYVRTSLSTSAQFHESSLETIRRNAASICNYLDQVCDEKQNIDVVKIISISYIKNSYIALSHPNCSYSYDKKKEIVKGLLKESFIPDYFFSINIFKLFMSSKKAAFFYFLHTLKLYRILFFFCKRRAVKNI